MRCVLIIDERFPSTGGSRTEKFVKYLPSFGWQPIVLTRSDARTAVPGVQPPPGTLIYTAPRIPVSGALRKLTGRRVGSLLDEALSVPDVQVQWVPLATLKALTILRQHRPQVIYTTSPSDSIHIIGLLVRRLTRLPWVADFRDCWTLNWDVPPPPDEHNYPRRMLKSRVPWHSWVSRRYEWMYFRFSDRIILVTDHFRQLEVRRYPWIEPKVTVITNGFDPKDLDVDREPPVTCKDGALSIGYMGGVYGYEAFLYAFAEALRAPGIAIQLHLWGTPKLPRLVELINDLGITQSVQFHPYLPHQQALAALDTCDVLLVLLGGRIPGLSIAVPQKMYNYFALRKPILAVVSPDGQAADVIRQTKAGMVVAYDDVSAITSALLELWHRRQHGALPWEGEGTEIAKYDRRLLTKKLAEVLDSVSHGQ